MLFCGKTEVGNANGTTSHVPAFPFISSSLFSALFGMFFFPLGVSLASLPTLCRCGNVPKLSTVKGLSSSHSPVLDPLRCVQREISVVLVIVVRFFLAAHFLCGALL